MGTKFPFLNFPVCKIYLGTWARRARRHVGHVGHAGHVGTLGTPLSRISQNTVFYKLLAKTNVLKVFSKS